MKTQFKYGLKNASAFLQQIKRQKYAQYQPNQHLHSRTFQEEEIPNSRVTLCEPKSQVVHNSKGVELSDLIMKQSLNKTLQIYRADLTQLEQNRANLIESIEQLSNKIQSFPELEEKNKILELENFKQKKEIQACVKQYHKKKIELFRKKLKQHQAFQRQKLKIKTLLDFCPEDHTYVVEVDSWKKYHYDLLQNQRLPLSIKIDQEKILQQIFKKKQKPEQKEQKKVSRKKMESEGLLGDLKMFAKNFKMPPKAPNQV